MDNPVFARASLPIFVDAALTESALELLKRGTAGHRVMFSVTPGSSMLSRAASDPKMGEAEVVFGQPDPAAVARSERVKWIQISSSGITRYDHPEFRGEMARRGIAVCNSASVFAESCALHVLSFLLAHTRRLPVSLSSRYAHGAAEWHALRGSCVSLEGQTAVILGYGAIGERLAEMLFPLRMKVVAYRRRARGNEKVPVVGLHELAAALARADHVINILPESGETRNFFDAGRFGQIRRGAVFYNIGRGATVDQGALVRALDAGQLSAAWLDVTEPEPLPEGHALWSRPNCFITPHTAGGHGDEVGDLVRHFLRNLERYQAGEALVDRVM